jgi:hypothetical protein
VLVGPFIGPLPDIAYEILHAERAGAAEMCMNVAGRQLGAALIRLRHVLCDPLTAPRILALIRALRGILPFPLVLKTPGAHRLVNSPNGPFSP